MQVWKETVFDKLQEDLTLAILNLIESNRNGETMSRELLKEALDSYSEFAHSLIRRVAHHCCRFSSTRLHIPERRGRSGRCSHYREDACLPRVLRDSVPEGHQGLL